MVYKTIINWWNSVDGKEEMKGIFLVADSYFNALEKLIGLFGEEDIMSLSLSPWSPDEGIIFDLDNPDHDWLFNKVDSDIGKTVFW